MREQHDELRAGREPTELRERTGAEVRAYINRRAEIDFDPVFAQYLITTQIPTLEYVLSDSIVRYRWTNVVPGFVMPVRVTIGGVRQWLRPSEIWRTTRIASARRDGTLEIDPDFYVMKRELTRAIPDVSSRDTTSSHTSPSIGMLRQDLITNSANEREFLRMQR